MRYKPYYLPQVSAPYNIVLQNLDNDGINYEVTDFNPDDLNPSQGITFSDDIERIVIDGDKPIWIAGDNKILDGHHRWIKAMQLSKPIKCVKIHMNDKDACRLLNKIQDIYEYEQNRSVEEIEVQDVINDENDIENEYLNSLENDNNELNDNKKNTIKIIAYRKEPIKENSVVGNFFTLKPIEGFSKYEIEFDNLLNTNDLGITYLESQQPVEILARIWFPNINFDKISDKYGVSSNNLKAKAIASKGVKLGYDGIKYGDTIIQGLK